MFDTTLFLVLYYFKHIFTLNTKFYIPVDRGMKGENHVGWGSLLHSP